MKADAILNISHNKHPRHADSPSLGPGSLLAIVLAANSGATYDGGFPRLWQFVHIGRARAVPTMTDNEAPAKTRSVFWLVPWGIAAAVIILPAVIGVWGLPSWPGQDTEHQAALSAAEHDEFVDSERLLRRVYERHPDDVVIVRTLGLGYLVAHRFDEADQFLSRWCELKPGETEPLQRRIELWMLQQKTSQAITDVQNVLQIQPNDDRARQILAQLLFIDARFDEAEREATKCLAAAPYNKEMQYLLACIYQQQGHVLKAIELVERMIRANPNSGPALALRANLFLDAGQTEPAIKLLTIAADNPALDLSFGGNPITRQWTNVVKQLSYVQDRPISFHRDNQPYPHTQMIAEQSLDRSIILFQLGQTLARAGRDKEAKRVLAEMQWPRALALWTSDKQRDVNAALQKEVVDAYIAADKLDAAVTFLNDILRRQPDARDTRLLLADCFDKQGQTERAAEQRRLSGRGK
jgi:tetratricopeptide (TPR) repeat protein